MISLGGTIGTGLFLASGASVAAAGPGGALIAYALIGIMVFFMMECLGEMVCVIYIQKTIGTYAIMSRRLHIFLFREVSITMQVDLLTLH
jgi:lysine-specific permease